MPLTVQCPTCRQLMKTAPKAVLKASKRCVFCGKTFKIHTPGGETRIVVAVPQLSYPESAEFERYSLFKRILENCPNQ